MDNNNDDFFEKKEKIKCKVQEVSTDSNSQPSNMAKLTLPLNDSGVIKEVFGLLKITQGEMLAWRKNKKYAQYLTAEESEQYSSLMNKCNALKSILRPDKLEQFYSEIQNLTGKPKTSDLRKFSEAQKPSGKFGQEKGTIGTNLKTNASAEASWHVMDQIGTGFSSHDSKTSVNSENLEQLVNEAVSSAIANQYGSPIVDFQKQTVSKKNSPRSFFERPINFEEFTKEDIPGNSEELGEFINPSEEEIEKGASKTPSLSEDTIKMLKKNKPTHEEYAANDRIVTITRLISESKSYTPLTDLEEMHYVSYCEKRGQLAKLNPKVKAIILQKLKELKSAKRLNLSSSSQNYSGRIHEERKRKALKR